MIVPNVWLRPNNMRKEADIAKKLLTVPDGDHLTLLNVYNSWQQSGLSLVIKSIVQAN
jgi:pre-mRNA-splicing factor ATP-dependent RNA helicase DHX15/PRP43